ncbi:hypothetical protein [uncultured Cohaesibacter sp.]|uniref:hypothetical protein n=1 Tax=uncultured Cohaesibacter sp. TaxID=1002546 RepID=UPI0029C7787E|nr:hypothetical protein [uncultured Cohaesibacter sp.]
MTTKKQDAPEGNLDEAAAKEAAAKKATPIKVLRDFWDDDGTRVRKGAEVKVTVEVAKKLIGENKAERADPLPGED